MEKIQHIVFLTPTFPQDEAELNCVPTLQAYLKNFVRLYPSIRISVICFHYPFRFEAFKWHGLDIYGCAEGPGSMWTKPLIYKRAYQYFRKLNKERSISLIHAIWLQDCALLGSWISRWYNIPLVVSSFGQGVRPLNKYLRLLNLNNFTTVCLSEYQAKVLEKTTGQKANYVIPMGIDPAEFPQEKNEERTIDVLGVGALIPLKRYDLLVRFISQLKASYPEVKAVLIGHGPELEPLIELAHELGVTSNITFTGKLLRTTVFEYMQKSKILLHPSSFEGQAYVYLEALYSGMYIVSSEAGGVHPMKDRWIIARQENEFAKGISIFLDKESKASSLLLTSVEETIEAYVAVYKALIRHPD